MSQAYLVAKYGGKQLAGSNSLCIIFLEGFFSAFCGHKGSIPADDGWAFDQLFTFILRAYGIEQGMSLTHKHRTEKRIPCANLFIASRKLD